MPTILNLNVNLKFAGRIQNFTKIILRDDLICEKQTTTFGVDAQDITTCVEYHSEEAVKV
jgi:hypothetical protein